MKDIAGTTFGMKSHNTAIVSPSNGSQDVNPDSFYTASNTVDGSSSNFNKTREMLTSGIYDAAYHERIRQITKHGQKHKLAKFQNRYSNLIKQPVQKMLSKNEAEAQRAMNKLKLNHSSKMLVQD